jgi:PAS domain S-box-containing protein
MEPISGGGYRVLVVHKDEGTLYSIKGFLNNCGPHFEVRTATSSEGALEAVGSEDFDCVVSEASDGEFDGIELLKSIRERGNTPVILFVGNSSDRVEEAIGSGTSDYVRMSLREFVARVEDPGMEQQDVLANRIRNVVERERARASYREIFDKMNDAIFVHDPETGEILDVNQRMCEMFGYSREEALELTIGDISAEDGGYTAGKGKEKVRKAREEGSLVFEWKDKKKDGEEFWVEVSLRTAFISGEERVLAVVRDISERKERERNLRKRSEAIEASMDGMAILDEDDEYVYVNEAHVDIYGYDDKEEFLGDTWKELYTGKELERFEAEIMPELRETGDWRGEATGVRKDGTEFEQEISLTSLEDGGLVCVVRDVTDRKEREKRLIESEEKFKALVEQNLAGIYVVKDGTFEYVNESFAEKIGEKPEDVIGNSPMDYVPDEEDREMMRENIRMREQGEVDSVRYSFTAETADGERKVLEVHGTRIELPDGPAIAGALVEAEEGSS